MTEIKVPMTLAPTIQKYILHWGEMGTRWGVNRTVAQIHALLFLSNRPLPAEDIAETLNVARSNVSNSLKELQSWGLVRIVHQAGDRRDHFVALQDVWEIFRVIVEERKKRESDPALEPASKVKMEQVLDFLEMLTATYGDYQHLPPATMQRFLKMGGKVARLLGGD